MRERGDALVVNVAENPLVQSALHDGIAHLLLEFLVELVDDALGRVGLPEDVAPVIAGLLSDGFGWVNAQRLEVSGGVQI